MSKKGVFVCCLLIISMLLVGCAGRQRAVLSAQTVSDVRGCEKIGLIELSVKEIAMSPGSWVGDSSDAVRSKCDKMGGNVILGNNLCYKCGDLDTEYNK